MTPANPRDEDGGRDERATNEPDGDRSEGKRPWWQHIWIWVATVVGGVVSAVLATWLTGTAGDDGDPPKPRLTQERFVRPLTDQGELRPPFKASTIVEKGNCWTASLYSTDPAAWRCGANSSPMDPCWDYALKVVCLSSPWDPNALIIKQADFAHRSQTSTKPGTLPWALEIKDPTDGSTLRCGWAGGATEQIAGQRVNWRCFSGDTDNPDTYMGDAAGEVSKSKTTPWTVLYNPKNSSEARPTEILTVWY